MTIAAASRLDADPPMRSVGAMAGERPIGDPELALRACEDRYRRFAEMTHEGVCLLDADSRITYVNRGLCEMLGYEQQELLGRRTFELMVSNHPASLHAVTPGNVDVALRHHDGGTVWAIVNAVPLFDEHGQGNELLATFTNVTQRRQAEEALRQREARFRALIENSNDVVLILDAAGQVQYQSPSMRNLIGRDVDCTGSSVFPYLHPEDTPAIQTAYTNLIAAPNSTELLAGRFLHDDGSWHSVEGIGTNLLHDAAVGGIVINFRDVTQRKLAELRARTAAEQIEQLTADAVFVADRSGHVLSWNHGAEQIFGWRRDEVLGSYQPIVPPQERDQAMAFLETLLAGGESITRETVRVAKDGRAVPVLGSWSAVPLENGETGVLGILKDITEHKHAAAQLRAQAESLAVLRERERIAMDLHDGVIQSLYGITLSLGALRRKARGTSTGNQWTPILGEAIGHLTDIIQGVRDYIFDLRSGLPEEGDLASGLTVLANQLQTSTGVRPVLSLAPDLASVPPASAAIVLYVAQEALSNVARHAQATAASVKAARSRGRWSLLIEDNGRGFDPAKRGRRRGDGLHNMRERARRLGGTLSVRSRAGSGTAVRLVFE